MDQGTAKDFIEDLMGKVNALEDSFRVLHERMEHLKEQRDRYADRLFALQSEYNNLLRLITKHVCIGWDCVICKGLGGQVD